MEESFDYKNMREERLNAITHAIGFLVSIPALVFLILKGVREGTGIAIVSNTHFGASMLLLFLTSTLLHSMPVKVKSFFAILDHSAIYVLLAGTYTPFMLLTLKGALGWTLFGIIWGLTLLGILFKVFYIHRFARLSLALYLIMGWLIVFAIKPLYLALPPQGIWLLIIGGLLYTAGSYFFMTRRVPYNHAIWHLFVMAGSASMYFCVLLYV